MQFIDLKKQYQRVESQIQAGIKQVLEHGRYIMGPEITELESALAEFVGAKHAVAVSSGTDAILMSLLALNIQPGDEIITSSFSFFATGEMCSLVGAVPVFVDIDPKTYNIDPEQIKKHISKKTKAIMPVSLYGQCADMDAINQIAAEYQIPVIEDAAQSFGAMYRGRRSCHLSTVACTSFFPSKPLGAYGDGGACFTDDDEIAEKLQQIRNHGQSGRYHHIRLGLNGRMDSMQAAVLLVKLSLFPEEIECRQMVADRYQHLLKDLVATPFIADGNTSVYAQYTIEVDSREQFSAQLAKDNIPTAIHYPQPLHQQPFYLQQDIPRIECPHAERVASRVISLPMCPYLSEQEQQQIAKAIQYAVK